MEQSRFAQGGVTGQKGRGVVMAATTTDTTTMPATAAPVQTTGVTAAGWNAAWTSVR